MAEQEPSRNLLPILSIALQLAILVIILYSILEGSHLLSTLLLLLIFLLLLVRGKVFPSKPVDSIAQVILLPVALGVALGYGPVGIQVFALAYLLLFVCGKVFPSQLLLSSQMQGSKNIYYVLFLVLSATMWAAWIVNIWTQESGFTETFDDLSLPSWEHSPDVAVIDGVLHVPSGGFAFHGGEWGDLSLTVWVRHYGEGALLIHYRVSDADGYAIHLGADFLAVRRAAGGKVTELKAVPVSIPPDEWVQVSVRVANGTHEVALNRQPTLTVTDPDPLPPGGSGFRVEGEATGEFDDFNIEGDHLLILPLQSDPALENWYWSTLIALLLVAAPTALILIIVGLIMRNTYLADYADHYKDDYPFLPTLWAMISIALGINKRVELVDDGKSRTLKAPSEGWARFAGPGLLIVADGHAVALEQGGRIRIVGAGITLLERYERSTLIVPLRSQTVARPVANVVTRDGIIIEEFNLFAYYQVHPGSGQPSERSEFVYDENNIRKIWKLAGKDWDNVKAAMESIADTSLRDIIARHDLDEIFAARVTELSPTAGQLEPRQRIKDEVRDQINKVSLEYFAIKVAAVDIGEVKIPEDAEKRLLEKWLADWAVRVAESKAQEARVKAMGGAEALTIEARGKREAAVEEGRGEAAAKAEQLAQVVEALRQAGLKDERLITGIIVEICRAAGYEEYLHHLERTMLPGFGRFLPPELLEEPEEGQANQ